MKRCFKCGEEKQFDEFYKHPTMADGYLGKCKECTKKDVKERYYNEIDKIRDYEKKRFKNPKRKMSVAKYQRKRRKNYPLKKIANVAIRNAVRDNKLKKQPCEVCGSTKSQAHHDDYSKPLDVRWLCFLHHRKIHGQLSYVTE